MRTLFLIVIPIIIGIGQILFKLSSRSAQRLDVSTAFLMLFNPWFVAAMILYAASTVAWVFVIRDVPIGRAYLFMALTYIVVPVAAWVFLGESLSPRHAIGTAFIIAGILIAAA
jgi:drug/metabolite transporter (DMT)-like permease